MSEIHWEKPEIGSNDGMVLGWMPEHKRWHEYSRQYIAMYWGEDFTAWMEMPPAPVKPKRFVVEEYKIGQTTYWQILNPATQCYRAVLIPTREAAQRIADIYEETTP